MARDYSGILAAVATVLKADATLVAALATRNGQPAISYTMPPTGRVFPCITVRDIGTRPTLPQLDDTPMYAPQLTVQVALWGVSDVIRPLAGQVDELLETAWRANSMDTSQWQINFIDTSGTWSTLDVPQEFVGGTIPIEMRVKTFTVEAALAG